MNEDAYEGHELLYFMLIEWRCPKCGQVYKLVRLWNEYSPEMDYCMGSFHPYDMQEMGEAEVDVSYEMRFSPRVHWFRSPIKHGLSTSQLVNSDEHDRLLVDTAYRLAR